jgi:hypothetical protein
VRRVLQPPPGSVRHLEVCGLELLVPSRGAAEWEDEHGARCLEANMTPLFTSLQPSNVVRLFSSVLLERSILVVATDSGPLFDTLEALRALVFPLTWYHIYLPALPDAFEGMTDNLGAPVTYLMGCAKGAEMLMDNVKFENCVVADLDDDVVSQYESVGLGVHKVAIVVGSGGGPRKPLAFCGVLLPRAPARCLVGARDLEHVILPTPFAARFWTRWTT